jgi:hypothetical protein
MTDIEKTQAFAGRDYLKGLTAQKQNLPPFMEAHFEFLVGTLRDDKKQAPRLLVVMKTVREFLESEIGEWDKGISQLWHKSFPQKSARKWSENHRKSGSYKTACNPHPAGLQCHSDMPLSALTVWT